MKITCKKCNITWPNLADYMNRSCNDRECVLLQPEVPNVAKKPPHINTSMLLVSPPKGPSPRQVKMRTLRREVDVVSDYHNSVADCSYIEVPQIICINLYPRGK